MSAARPEFQRVQRALAAHLRDPDAHLPPAGMEERRLQIYRELFYNTVENTLANAFPVLRRISKNDVWHARVRDFYARHVSRAPQLYRLAEEFVKFIETERGAHADDPLFLAELVHYEWVELALSIAQDPPAPESCDPDGDPLCAPPLISPLAWPLAYTWPVHLIAPDATPDAPPAEPTYLLVYRDAQDEVRFMQLNAVSALLLQLIEQHPQASGAALLADIAARLGLGGPQPLVEDGRRFLEGLRKRGVLLGTRR